MSYEHSFARTSPPGAVLVRLPAVSAPSHLVRSVPSPVGAETQRADHHVRGKASVPRMRQRECHGQSATAQRKRQGKTPSLRDMVRDPPGDRTIIGHPAQVYRSLATHSVVGAEREDRHVPAPGRYCLLGR